MKRAPTYRARANRCRAGAGRVATTGPHHATTGMQRATTDPHCPTTGLQRATTDRQLVTTGPQCTTTGTGVKKETGDDGCCSCDDGGDCVTTAEIAQRRVAGRATTGLILRGRVAATVYKGAD